jgi:thymidylate synthase ThyX
MDFMKIELIGSTAGFVNVPLEAIALEVEDSPFKTEIMNNMLDFSLKCARVCYTEKDFQELLSEKPNQQLLERLIGSGHHSVFEHMTFNLNFKGIPKALAMVLNNEKQYATSEKSARYTKMKDLEPSQRKLYDKWDSRFFELIANQFPEDNFPKLYIKGSDGKRPIDKLAQENARYITSVFTPTKMVHTLNWRQLNFLMNRFEEFVSPNEKRNCSDEYAERLEPSMKSFNSQLSGLKVEEMDNQTDRHLSLFQPVQIQEHFGSDIYSTFYLMSFAGLAQAHRHRTINYNFLDEVKRGAELGFFIPKLILGKSDLEQEWMRDLVSVASYDFPQAQLLSVAERGMIEDFRSKTLLRMCGHAQQEIMENTSATAKKYTAFQEEYGSKSLEPKCIQGQKCTSPCVWGGKNALTRLI